jgi:hypothetical protein
MSEETGGHNSSEETASEPEEFILNPWKRVAMVIFSPQRVYEGLRVKSSRLDWIVPLVFTMVLGLFIVNAWRQYLENDQIAAVTAQIEKNTSLTEEQKTARLAQTREGMENAAGFTRIMSNVGVVIGGIAVLAVIALVMKILAGVFLHGRLAFGDAFRIAALGSMVSFLGGLIKIPLIIYFESFQEATLSLGILFPEEVRDAFFLKVLNFDLFTLWYLVLLGIGMAVFLRSSLQKTLVPLAVVWMVYRIAAIALSSGISSIGT